LLERSRPAGAFLRPVGCWSAAAGPAPRPGRPGRAGPSHTLGRRPGRRRRRPPRPPDLPDAGPGPQPHQLPTAAAARPRVL